jgi:DNA primase
MSGEDLDDRIPLLLERINLVELVQEFAGPPQVSGARATFRCPSPSHDDRRPSFTVDAGRWRCWSACNTGGDALDLVVWLDGCTMAEAIERLAQRCGLRRSPCQRTGKVPTRDAAAILHRFLSQRQWSPATADVLGLRVVTDGRGGTRIRFPFRLNGEEVFHQDRALGDARPKWLSPKGGTPVLYEADRLARAGEVGEVVLVEGVSDVVALVEVFENPAVIGVPGAGGLKDQWAPAFTGLRAFVVADNDTAGAKLRTSVDKALSGVAAAVAHVFVPEEHHDLDDWRCACNSAERFAAELNASCDAALAYGPVDPIEHEPPIKASS